MTTPEDETHLRDGMKYVEREEGVAKRTTKDSDYCGYVN
jgi:hypothetical protein